MVIIEDLISVVWLLWNRRGWSIGANGSFIATLTSNYGGLKGRFSIGAASLPLVMSPFTDLKMQKEYVWLVNRDF